MATLADSLVTTITTEWGNGGGGGAAPTIAALVDYRKDIAPTTEQIVIRLPIYADRTPINDTYANVKHRVLIRVKTTTSDTRLYEIVDELRWIVNNVAVTGIDRQFCSGGEDKTDASRQIFIYDMWVTCEEHVASSATAYSAGTSANIHVTGDLQVDGSFSFDTGEDVDVILDEDNMASDDEDALATQQSIKAYVDTVILTEDTLAEMNDTTIAGLADNDVLTYDSGTSKWINENDATIGGEITIGGDLKLTQELDMTGAAAKIDLNPANATGANILDITPSAALSSGSWRGLRVDGAALDPSAGGVDIRGLDIVLGGVSLANAPALKGIYITMPAAYGAGNESAIYMTGDGRSINMLSDAYALEVVGDVNQQSGTWTVNCSTKQYYYLIYNNRVNGSPFFRMGASVNDNLDIQTIYNGGTQTLDYLNFKTVSSSGVNTDGNMRFLTDGTEVVRFNTAADTNQVKITGNLEVSGNITDTTDTMTVANLADLLMFGSTNAAWVPCIFLGESVGGVTEAVSGVIRNKGTTNSRWTFELPLPPLKGALKLYVTGLKLSISDADANNYVNTVYVVRTDENGPDALAVTDSGTDRTAAGEYEYTIADVDCSAYHRVTAELDAVVDTNAALDVAGMRLLCFYAA